jgi:hypothetical protein
MSNHIREIMVKKQEGLTIIQLMVLLLIAGIAGSLLLKVIIDHRCQADQSASMCHRNASAAELKAFDRFNSQPV